MEKQNCMEQFIDSTVGGTLAALADGSDGLSSPLAGVRASDLFIAKS